VRSWARQAGIEPARVQRRQITLNHDRGHWFSLGAPGPLPATFEQVNGQWQRLH
jgi:integrating conjugative element protein (TIGR03759 family)